MKILKKADQIYIAKRLAAINYIAENWKTDDIEYLEKVINNLADVAYRVGGLEMMEDIPRLLDNLRMHKGAECACQSPCNALKFGNEECNITGQKGD
ncbi:MAG: hypothetical protein J6S50_02505 [Oscillospiraceae bacterium]|nr:hypothetical protein [Oscillospiraceae bacterium]